MSAKTKRTDHGDVLYDERGLAEMIIEAPAVLAILKQERAADEFARAIEENPDCRMSVVDNVETANVLDRDPDPCGRTPPRLAARTRRYDR
ncbi:MAG: type II toxin-antitoxin system VapC family toxin [Rhizomicrobium sp.]